MVEMRVTKDDYIKAANDLGAALLWNEPIEPGDAYLAGRNTGIKLLICKTIYKGCVYPDDTSYPYDIGECVKITL